MALPQGRERLYVLGVRRDSLRKDLNFDDIFPAKLQQHAVASKKTKCVKSDVLSRASIVTPPSIQYH